MEQLMVAGPLNALFFIIIFGIVLILPLIALIDILRNEFTGYNKIIWVLVFLFFPVIGMILYFAIGGGHKIRRP